MFHQVHSCTLGQFSCLLGHYLAFPIVALTPLATNTSIALVPDTLSRRTGVDSGWAASVDIALEPLRLRQDAPHATANAGHRPRRARHEVGETRRHGGNSTKIMGAGH